MKHFCIITNSDKNTNYDIAHHIVDFFEKKGCTCVIMENKMSQSAGIRHYTDVSKIPEDAECAIVLGGDGTMIQAAIDLVHSKLPILGVNTGNLGFLTEVERQDIDTALSRLIDDDYTIENRIMLKEISYFKQPDSKSSCYALNDIVVSKRGSGRLITVRVYLNDELADIYRADGLIISTPTGSTGYNLSAGGPIIEPGASILALTPINAHNLNSKGIILKADDVIEIEMVARRGVEDEAAYVSCDGDRTAKLLVGDRFIVERANHTIKICKVNKQSFLETMRKKMR